MSIFSAAALAAAGFAMYRRVRSREPGPIRRVRRRLRRIAGAASVRGVQSPDLTGWEEWGRSAKKAGFDAAAVECIVSLVEHGLYSQRGFSKDDFRELHRLRRRM